MKATDEMLAVVYFSDDPGHDAGRAKQLLDLDRRVLMVPNRLPLTGPAASYLFDRYWRPGKSPCVIMTGVPILSMFEAGDLTVGASGQITKG